MRARPVAAKSGGSRFKFFGETMSELKKVVWLTRREALYLTALVLVVAIGAGVVLGVFDYLFSRLVELFLLGG